MLSPDKIHHRARERVEMGGKRLIKFSRNSFFLNALFISVYTFCRYVRLSKTKEMLLVRLYAMQPASQLNQAIYITRFKDSTHQIHNSNNHHWWMVLGKKEEKPYFESVKAPITTLLQAPHVYQKHTYILYAQREGSLAGWMGW